MIRDLDEPAITVRNLYKSYGARAVINDLSFVIPKGIVFSLIGPNGAGKTTTISLLEGLLCRDSGDIRVLGMDPWNELDLLKMKIGVLPQGFNFFDKLTPFDAVRFYCSLFGSSTDPKSLLGTVSLIDQMNMPYEKLSGGQKQKLGLALALVNDPEILFLDEPTTGLDPVSRRSIWAIIKEFKKRGNTVVLTTHYMEEAEQLSDIVAIIRKGELMVMGKPEEVIAQEDGKRTLKLRANSDMANYLRNHGVEVTETGDYLQIMITPEFKLSRLAELIESSGLRYSNFSVSGMSLEDLYIRLVGGTGVEA